MRREQTKRLLKTVDILPLLSDIANHRQEHFVCLSLDGGSRLITKRIVFIGTVDAVMSHPREVFSGAVADLATGVIVGHNHPSGDPNPSKQDLMATQQLVAAGQILGIRLIDHLIVAGEGYYSFRASGLI